MWGLFHKPWNFRIPIIKEPGSLLLNNQYFMESRDPCFFVAHVFVFSQYGPIHPILHLKTSSESHHGINDHSSLAGKWGGPGLSRCISYEQMGIFQQSLCDRLPGRVPFYMIQTGPNPKTHGDLASGAKGSPWNCSKVPKKPQLWMRRYTGVVTEGSL